MEYLATEVLELTGNAVRDKKSRIIPVACTCVKTRNWRDCYLELLSPRMMSSLTFRLSFCPRISRSLLKRHLISVSFEIDLLRSSNITNLFLILFFLFLYVFLYFSIFWKIDLQSTQNFTIKQFENLSFFLLLFSKGWFLTRVHSTESAFHLIATTRLNISKYQTVIYLSA